MIAVPRPIANLPWVLLISVCLIAGVGLLTLYSTAGGSLEPWALRQGLIFVAVLGAALVIRLFPESFIKAMTPLAYVAVLVLLVLVEAMGYVGKGAQRWIDLGFMKLQPSEFMKVVIVLVLAYFYELLPAGDLRKLRALWPPALLIGIPVGLILLQPDLGTALAVCFVGVVVMFLAGLPMWYFVAGGLSLLAALPIAYAFMHDYQRRRVLIFLDPEADPLGAGYHISQSKIAIGSGGTFGKGYLDGSQSHLQYLPEGHTDFIFSAMVEEWGLVGGVVLILAFAVLIGWGLRLARTAPTRFARLASAGLASNIFFYVAVNLMMVMGMAPVVGIPLPLVSHGGSTVMTVMLSIGVLMAFDRQRRNAPRYQPDEG
ncbi:rod shape-determining protein RodA [Sphingomicrobium clamense]|uniref:Peptidoglycan glycosyltransferase MrdB n=1 Tax=Sphingomicrobium clamense TaxID=2851013 RepID=A0ABS6V6U0_9SPHN|nr:rod shape-determining protein RodA [Sphingomicrobium sp. B8]MBW0145279.1 rod shape-determining protein RodA [Sphingomicrobium sp. B8]